MDFFTFAAGIVSDGFMQKFDENTDNTVITSNSSSMSSSNTSNADFLSNNDNNASSEVDLNERIMNNIESDIYALVFCILCFINLLSRIISYKSIDARRKEEEVSPRSIIIMLSCI